MSIVASLVVKFGSGADSSALVKMEWDDVLNVDAAGEKKANFNPGDPAFFILHHDPVLRIGRVAVTHGQVVRQSPVSRTRSQQLLFAEPEDSLELEYLPSGVLVPRWFVAAGNEPALRRNGARAVEAVGGVLPALGEVSYPISAQGYKLITPNVSLGEDESYPITVVAWMEAAI